MNINDLTYGQLKTIADLFNFKLSPVSPGPASSNLLSDAIGEKVIVRTCSAGVWFGELNQRSGKEVVLKDARRMWRWWAAESISLSGAANYGVKPDKSKIAPSVAKVWLEAIEIIACTSEAIESIEGCSDAKAE